MEPPVLFEADALRDEKVKVLRATRTAGRPVLAQYEGYRAERGVVSDSMTPTYAALRLYVDNWRWRGVPFFLRSGKRLRAKSSEISIQFKAVPHLLFPLSNGAKIAPNILSLCLQPDEGIHLQFEAKHPGAGMSTRSVDMEFHYADQFATGLPEAYERLLLDALQGDASLFARADEIELAWGLVDPIVTESEQSDALPLARYEPGCWGPEEAEQLLAADERGWLYGCGGRE
jgi:glucose-6-phosphate 1-dehydrogenase